MKATLKNATEDDFFIEATVAAIITAEAINDAFGDGSSHFEKMIPKARLAASHTRG